MTDRKLFALNSMLFVINNLRTRIAEGSNWIKSRLSKILFRKRYAITHCHFAEIVF